ncbi:hypothetical protein GCM10022254_04710 [Actinomadura meridiana]|uniref:DUF8129 domain-containing protein n=1 Tax=Actinomadura meridiana TaxID=559626 RepID=A0ABP8BSY8_9ACTN
MTRSPRRLKQQVQDSVGEQVRDLPLHAVRLAMFGVGRALLLGDRVSRDYKEITEGGGVRPVLGRLRDDVQETAEKVVERVVERVRGDQPESESEPTTSRHAEGEEISIGKPDDETQHTPKHARPGAPPKPARPGALGRHHAQSEGKSADTAADKPEPQPETKPEPKAEAGPQPETKPEPKAAAEPESKPEPKPKTRPETGAKGKPAEPERVAKDLPVPDYDHATLPQLRARLRGLSVDQVRLLREYEREHAAREDVIGMYERRIAKLNGSN